MSKERTTVEREVARYGTTPARPIYMALCGTSLREKVSTIVFCLSQLLSSVSCPAPSRGSNTYEVTPDTGHHIHILFLLLYALLLECLVH